jgi:hypothetical protein
MHRPFLLALLQAGYRETLLAGRNVNGLRAENKPGLSGLSRLFD